MLKKITEKEAKRMGFTHHGRYYSLPVWLALNQDELKVCSKYEILDYLMDAVHHIEITIQRLLGYKDIGFTFAIGHPIK